MMILTKLNNFLAKASYLVGIIIVAIMVMALSLSAITRYVSGTGYDWLIELPPVLICWLVFPLLGPLLREGNHIQVDFLTSIISTKQAKYLKIMMNLTAFIASLIFFKAGMEATMLYFNLGQMMELEIDIPIWWMYLSFPVGFIILALFSLELTTQSILDLNHNKAKDA
ncbi:MAG: TRAP transporter small permease subunit [Paracoccaceae bacterium]|jgi:TRAP-type C4-dicarboxylate transport system permease small subunit|nr:TRAP transporter small permease subunit [Paracoccaceae bacterium]|tara:strand:+ start:1102 stop:1608 length:507 start_codon:yes stop_codon:yes gene_type:complete